VLLAYRSALIVLHILCSIDFLFSMTIARYLILEARVQSPLWPLNFERQARISEYLDWSASVIQNIVWQYRFV